MFIHRQFASNSLLWFAVVGVIFLSLGLLLTTQQAAARPSGQDAQQGGQLFTQYCQACHSIGKGDLIGPDLQGVTQRRDQTWLVSFITQPDQVLVSGDTIAGDLLKQYSVPMPNLGISEPQALAILAYLENPGAAPAQAQTLPAGGQPEIGKALFSGQTMLANGGTSCVACHSTTGIGFAGGGTLGPDLTNVFTRLGNVGLSSSLATLPFPTMQGIFTSRPLTPEEQAHLFAYFQQTDQQKVVTSQANSTALWAAGFVGALALFAGMLVFWPRQRASISSRLRKKL